MIRVNAVQPESLGEELGLAVGTELLSVNGRAARGLSRLGVPDRRGCLHAPRPPAGRRGDRVRHRAARRGCRWGSGSRPPRIRRCANRCDFCFVDGLPTGLRDTLYIRDDDYRLSFRYGNFATLTNLKPRDVDRIIEYRLSPLYVSVHATDPTVRRWLLRNPTAPDILEQLRGFADARHPVPHPDRDVARRQRRRRARAARSTISTPSASAVLSVSVVPVGLTEFSKHHLVREPTAAECAAAVRLVERHAAVARARSGAWRGASAPTSSTSARGSRCPGPRRTTTSTRWKTASARCGTCRRASGRGRGARRTWRASGSACSPARPWGRSCRRCWPRSPRPPAPRSS